MVEEDKEELGEDLEGDSLEGRTHHVIPAGYEE